MRLCKYCNAPMVKTFSFSKDKQEKFYRCPKCHGETRHTVLRDDELYNKTLDKNRIKGKPSKLHKSGW